MNIFNVLIAILTPDNFIWFVGGTITSIIAGILPGIGDSLTLALFIPVTFYLKPEAGLVYLIFLGVGIVLALLWPFISSCRQKKSKSKANAAA